MLSRSVLTVARTAQRAAAGSRLPVAAIASRRAAPPVLRAAGLHSAAAARAVHGVAANKGVDDAELASRIAAWKKPYVQGLLTPDELEHFHEEGYVLKKDVFDPAELQPCLDAIAELVDELAGRLHAAGKIQNLHADAGVFERLSLIEKQFKDAPVLLHKKGFLPPAVQRLWSDERLLSAARQIVGPNIAGHPVWNLRAKTPQQEQATVPWHQDVAYLDPSCWTTLQLTAWVPMLDANLENGCMQVVRRGHRTGRTAHHTCCAGDTWYVVLPPEEMEATLDVKLPEDIVTCEVPFGSVLFLNNLIPHRSLNNVSNDIRWSFDLRWQDPSEPTGFEEIKGYVLMQKENDPTYKIDWNAFADQTSGRTQKQMEVVADKSSGADDEFDGRIAGPWMLRWEMTHENRHTDLLKNSKDAIHGWHKA